MNSVDQALIAFSKQEISGMAAVRVMAESDGWYVPALFAVDKFKTDVADHAIVLSVEFQSNPRNLVMFSDADAVNRAAGRPLGPISGRFSGAEIFRVLTEADYDVIDVNPGSPREQTFYMEKSTFSMLRLIAQTVKLEQALLRCSDTYVPFAEIKAHSGYMIAINENNTLFTLNLSNPPGAHAVVFTSPDRVELFNKAAGMQLKTTGLDGASLFTQLNNFDINGVIVNNGSPKYFVLPKSYFPHILAAR